MVLVRRRWCAWGLGAGAAVALARWWPPLTAALPLLGLVALARAAAAGAATWLATALPRRPLRDLRRRAVLVTGCDSGFGHEAALRFHALGAPVFAGVLLPQGPGAARLRQMASPRMRVLPLDVTDEGSVAEARRAVDQFLSEGDCELWAVVNNAGVLGVGEAEWMEMEDVKKCMDVNAFGQVRVTKAFLPLLKKSKGRVININSQASTIVAPTINPYTMSKFASLAYTDSLRYDMEKFSISVHSIEPAMYRTPLVQSTISVCKQKLKQIPNDVRNTYCEHYEQKFLKLHYLSLHLTAMPQSRTFQVVDAIEDACFDKDPQDTYIPGEGSKFTSSIKDILPFLASFTSKILYR
ncbi:hypothetical protein R5R35_011230 [Gryllus longicercus]|uniref:Estradiol 17-beta-dehydrogenase 2 n=1 Tax=Gryllus longicercus TaxID=2509291 RepID=A0AAN9V0P1_9ORTH